MDGWRLPQSTQGSDCQPVALPSGTLIIASASQTMTLDSGAVFESDCGSEYLSSTFLDGRIYTGQRTFNASSTPIACAISSTTAIAWFLLLNMLASRKKFPLLQMFSALITSIALTVALSETIIILNRQFDYGYQDAYEMRVKISNRRRVPIVWLISAPIIFLAQVQTLLRCYPRCRERQVIKWCGICLICIGTVFTGLQQFLFTDADDSFVDALPALAYLFQIALSVIYAGCVFVYSISQRRFAYHKSNLIIATISLASIMVPIIFFGLDVASDYIAAWGDYIRWIGLELANVTVWHWVDCIQEIDLHGQVTGVLGRQIFEEEMSPRKNLTLGNPTRAKDLSFVKSRQGSVASGFTNYRIKPNSESESLQTSSNNSNSTPRDELPDMFSVASDLISHDSRNNDDDNDDDAGDNYEAEQDPEMGHSRSTLLRKVIDDIPLRMGAKMHKFSRRLIPKTGQQHQESFQLGRFPSNDSFSISPSQAPGMSSTAGSCGSYPLHVHPVVHGPAFVHPDNTNNNTNNEDDTSSQRQTQSGPTFSLATPTSSHFYNGQGQPSLSPQEGNELVFANASHLEAGDQMEVPPDFVPLPGFSIGDYHDDKVDMEYHDEAGDDDHSNNV